MNSAMLLPLMVVAVVLWLWLLTGLTAVSRKQARQKAQLTRYVTRRDVQAREHGQWLIGFITSKEQQRLLRLLANAGFHHKPALVWLLGSKLGSGLLLSVVLLLRQWLNEAPLISMWSLTLCLVGYVAGANLPEWWLNLNADRNRKLLKQATPDAIDLLVLCVESGLSLNRAFLRVSHYLSMQASPMAEQFRITAAELDMLNDRHQALANLSWRTGVPELHTLASTLQMAEKYGSPLTDTLRQISDDARRQRGLYIEEVAGRLPGKITLIQMGLIMLPMLVMIVAPILSQLLASLA